MKMTKQLFLALVACALVIAPGCSKKTKAPTYKIIQTQEEQVEILNPEQLEQDRKHYAKRGIALIATSPLPLGAGGFAAALAAETFHFHCLTREIGIPMIIVSALALGGGIYMLGQGIHDLAKAKKLRRIQMKAAAQQRRLEREARTIKIENIEEYAS